MPNDKTERADREGPDAKGTPWEVWLAFLRLGMTAFGGPVAHIGYFETEFVRRRKWIETEAFADLVALCQFLPGPASSQVGFALGLKRAGPLGAMAAWLGFTLPSAMFMVALAYGLGFMNSRWAQGALHGLKLVAVAVVAQAVWSMARRLTPDLRRGVIAVGAALTVTVLPGALGQLGAMVCGLLSGMFLCREAPDTKPDPLGYSSLSQRSGWLALTVFVGLLAGLPLMSLFADSPMLSRFNAFYWAGALVFGGGHVVLPLLKEALVDPGWISSDIFLAGYGAAQAVPGPLFTFAAFLGASMPGPPNGVGGALVALAGIFLPGMLTLLAVMPFWTRLRQNSQARSAMSGANAAVVGILAAALYHPIWTSSVHGLSDIAMAGAGLVLLSVFEVPPIVIVCLGAIMGAARVMFLV